MIVSIFIPKWLLDENRNYQGNGKQRWIHAFDTSGENKVRQTNVSSVLL